jgi:hypothetical protein
VPTWVLKQWPVPLIVALALVAILDMRRFA